jgi:hypothetical protein
MQFNYAEWIDINRKVVLLIWLQLCGTGVISGVCTLSDMKICVGFDFAEFIVNCLHLALNYYIWIHIFEFVWQTDNSVIEIFRFCMVGGVTVAHITQNLFQQYYNNDPGNSALESKLNLAKMVFIITFSIYLGITLCLVFRFCLSFTM